MSRPLAERSVDVFASDRTRVCGHLKHRHAIAAVSGYACPFEPATRKLRQGVPETASALFGQGARNRQYIIVDCYCSSHNGMAASQHHHVKRV